MQILKNKILKNRHVLNIVDVNNACAWRVKLIIKLLNSSRISSKFNQGFVVDKKNHKNDVIST